MVKNSALVIREMPVFQGVVPCHTGFASSCVILLWDSATAYSPPVKTSTLFLRKNHVSYNLLLCNVLILPGHGFIWIGTHPYYSLSVYVLLYYLRSTSIATERCYPKYFILCLVNFYSKRSALSKIFYLWLTYFHSEKDHRLSEQCSTRLAK